MLKSWPDKYSRLNKRKNPDPRMLCRASSNVCEAASDKASSSCQHLHLVTKHTHCEDLTQRATSKKKKNPKKRKKTKKCTFVFGEVLFTQCFLKQFNKLL